MAKVEIKDGTLTVTMPLVDRIFALHGNFSIPMDHVVGVEAGPKEARGWFHGLRMPGTALPGVFTAGTFITREGLIFFDVHDAERTIAIELRDETYKRLILEVDKDETPELVAERVRAAIAAHA